MASEKTPLLPKLPGLEFDAAHLPCSLRACSMCEKPTIFQRLFDLNHIHIFVLAFRHHWVMISLALVSSIVNNVVCGLGYAQNGLVDSAFMKMFFALMCFLLGFRNSTANQRRIEAMTYVEQLMGAIWAIFIVTPVESRQRTRKYFVAAIESLVHQLPAYTTELNGWFIYNALHPMLPENPVVDGKIPVVLSARSLFVIALQFAEAEIHRVEEGKDQSAARNLYHHRSALLSAYDGIVTCALPAVSQRYLAFCDVCIGWYLVALPWALNLKHLHVSLASGRYVVLPAACLRCFLVLAASLVLCGLEGLTRENEHPLEKTEGLTRHNDDPDDVQVQSLHQVFEQAAACFEERAKCISQQQLPTGQRDADNIDIEALTVQRVRTCDETCRI